MVDAAHRAGMRLIGPNCHGLANFATGMVANFSTIFNELEARDGPVAIVSQSGANSQAIYTLLRDKGLSARHVHATGNEADVTVADLAAAVVADEGVRLVLLYMEAIKDPPTLAAVPAEKLKAVLPAFAAVDNPIDVTGALLGNSGLFGGVLPIVGEAAQCDVLVLALPVAGTGYDVPRFAQDLAAFQRRYGIPSALAAPQPAVREPFAAAGVATFAAEGEAMDALAQVADHVALLRRPAPPLASIAIRGPTRFLNEAESLALLAQAELPVIEHRLCRDEQDVQSAVSQLGEVVMKACSRDLPHKSDHGLVAIGVPDPIAEFRRQRERCLALGARFEGVIVARRARGGRELALGARIDPSFGPLVLVGDGGIYLEALKDFRLLVPPFREDEVLAKIAELRVAPLLGPLRGQLARDVGALARMAVRLGEALLAWDGRVASVDVNPVMVFETGAVALDALVESRSDD